MVRADPEFYPGMWKVSIVFDMDRKLDQCVFSSKNALIWFSVYLIMTDLV